MLQCLKSLVSYYLKPTGREGEKLLEKNAILNFIT